MNPITVQIYDVKTSEIRTKFLDMCTSTCSTAEALFNAMDHKLATLLDEPNPWLRCTSCGLDNTSTNIGCHNSLSTRIKAKNPSVYISKCPCHFIHNAAQKACKIFSSSVKFDLFYWFDKSKNELKSFCDFCDQQYRSVIKHISTCWLSLELAMDRTLKQLPSLTSYFQSNDFSQARFDRLKKAVENPMAEVYLLFLHSVLPTFTHTNQFSQKEEPLIHLLKQGC